MRCVLLIPFSLSLATGILFANPQDPTVVSGTASFTNPHSHLLEIAPSDGAIINWKDFSIQPNEITRFIQPGISSRVLNRVTGSNLSNLLGALEANGQIYLINPHGVLIGKDAVIRTGSLFISTFDLSDDLFTNGSEWTLKGHSNAAIVNHGTVQAQDGDLYLISQKVVNFGTVQAPNGVIELAAGNEILVRPHSTERVAICLSKEDFNGCVDNEGFISAIKVELQAAINPYSLAIRQKGHVEGVGIVSRHGRVLLETNGQIFVEGTMSASNVNETGGNIDLFGDSVEILPLASLDVSGVKGGGNIAVGNKGTRYVRVDQRAALNADAREHGNGGKIILWGEQVCASMGDLSARGGKTGGHGGFIELSGNGLILPEGHIDTHAPFGKTGTLLLDPTHVIISTAVDTPVGPFLGPPPPPPPPPSGPIKNYSFVSPVTNINNMTLSTLLGSNNVVINTANGPGALGDIDVNAPVTWSSSFGLFLRADDNINVNDIVSATGTGVIDLLATNTINIGDITNLTPSALLTQSGTITLNTTNGNLNINGGGAVGAFAEVSTVTGTVSIPNVGVDLVLTGGNSSGTYAQIGKGSTSVGGAGSIDSTFNLQFINGDVHVNGGTGAGAYAQIGDAPSPTSGTSLVISMLLATNLQGSVFLNGGTAAATTAIIGYGNEVSSTLSNITADIDLEPFGAIQLTGGSGSNSHAVIGFHMSQIGSTPLTVNSTKVIAEVVAFGDMTLTGGSGGNAIIGFYNTSSTGCDVTIGNLSVNTPRATNTFLQAGILGTAVIGTFSPQGTAQSNINMLTGRVSLLGSGGSGQARIVNNFTNFPMSIFTSAPFDIDIEVPAGSGIIELLGGTGSGFADIYSSRDLLMNCNSTYTVNNTAQTAPARVVGFNIVEINTTAIANTISVVGGGASNAEALILCVNGPVQIGLPTSVAATTLIVGDAASQSPSRILSNSGAASTNVFGMTILTGGSGAGGAQAEIGQINGSLEVDASNSITLTGGSSTGSYAQIGARNGPLNISCGGALLLQGGTATDTYAQIGIGLVSDTSPVNSTITFNLLNSTVSLFGGSAIGAYAQIGHSPFNGGGSINVQGDINFPAVGAAGATTLTGGSVSTATAIIGHGNEVSDGIQSCIGNINVICDTDITLQAGTGPNTHAIIGFHSPTAGSTAAFNVSVSSVNVTTFNGQIQLIAENQSNATIGYYNAATPSSVSVVLTPITVLVASGANNISLFAGNNAGSGHGIAAIGTFASMTSTTESAINVSGSTVLLQGPPGGQDGAARIVNNFYQFMPPIFTAAPFDVSVITTSLELFGGLGGGFADIYSSEHLLIQFTNLFTVNTPADFGFAHIIAFDNLSINPNGSFGTASLAGGMIPVGMLNPPSDALIESINGFVTLGNTQAPGTTNLTIGQSTSHAPSQIIASIGSNTINASNNISLQGGLSPFAVALIADTQGAITVVAGNQLSLTGGTGGNNATAEIRNNLGTVAVTTGGNASLLGGGSFECYAQISSIDAPMTLSIGGSLSLTGGSAAECYAEIGKGFDPNVTSVSSDILIPFIGGDLILQGSTTPAATAAFAQIGHATYGSPSPITVQGAVNLSNILGSVHLNGGTGNFTTAIIGHGNEFTPNIFNVSGNISVLASGMNGITLTPSTGLQSHTVIGFQSPSTVPGSMFGYLCISNLVDVESFGGPITLNGGVKENAIIGYYNALTPTHVDVSISLIKVLTPLNDSNTNAVTLQAGNDNASSNGVAVIGTFAKTTPSTTQSNISIQAGILNVLGPTTVGFDGSARIINNRPNVSAGFDVSIQTVRTNIRGGTAAATAFAEVYSSRDLTFNFQKAFNLNFNPLSPGTLQHGNATVTAFRNIISNASLPPSLGTVTFLGGNTPAVLTLFEALNGSISIGNLAKGFTGAGDINLGPSGNAMIGPVQVLAPNGDITGYIGGSLNLNGGVGVGSLSEINAGKNLTFQTIGAINLTAGIGVGAVAELVSVAGNLNVLAMGPITLTGSPAALAEILNLGGKQGSITVSTFQDIFLNNNSLIENNGDGSTTLDANNNITLSGNATVKNQGSGALSSFSGVSTFLRDTSLMQSIGTLTIVVDNLFPVPPGIGPGAFVLDAGATITTPTLLRIFTATRSQNQINGLINFVPYIPGIEFVDSATEIWNTYYPSDLGGTPFTIFYKDFIPVPVPIIVHRTAHALFFQDLRTYDELFFRTIPIYVSYNGDSHFPETISSFDLIADRIYDDLRRYFRNYHTKWIDPLK